ncbi:MAG: hypothetical protein MK194_10245, partial [Roseibacillus sp.]|nr:hypothetical protein [Roseibacillus sp.]
VFRFALERWPADQFELLVTSRGELKGELREKLDALQKTLAADSNAINLKVKRVDLDALTEAERISLPALDHAGEGPTLVLMPPESWKTGEPVWVGEATAGNLDRMLDSPLRQRCGEHLVKGISAVWVLVECGDPEKDRMAREVLEAGVKQASTVLELPEGIIRREDLNKNFENIDPDNILRSDVPLEISFVTEVISRDDPAEALFLPMLLEPEALALDEPLIVPVFGRGRTFGGMAASQATAERIVGASEYLCGACSCQVKEGNPGYDLLFQRNWDAILKVEEITPDSEVIQRNLEVVTFNPGEEPVAAAVPEAGAESGHKRLLIGLVVFNLLAFGVLGYLRYRNRAVAS